MKKKITKFQQFLLFFKIESKIYLRTILPRTTVTANGWKLLRDDLHRAGKFGRVWDSNSGRSTGRAEYSLPQKPEKFRLSQVIFKTNTHRAPASAIFGSPERTRTPPRKFRRMTSRRRRRSPPPAQTPAEIHDFRRGDVTTSGEA